MSFLDRVLIISGRLAGQRVPGRTVSQTRACASRRETDNSAASKGQVVAVVTVPGPEGRRKASKDGSWECTGFFVVRIPPSEEQAYQTARHLICRMSRARARLTVDAQLGRQTLAFLIQIPRRQESSAVGASQALPKDKVDLDEKAAAATGRPSRNRCAQGVAEKESAMRL